jgi:glycosyltransferase involved in cell wall biosynthesis
MRPNDAPTGDGAPLLSVVIPAFNEEGNLRPMIAHVVARLDALGAPYEVIVVNDGSTDGTAALAEELAREYAPRMRVLHNPANLKLGATLRRGYAAATGRYILYTDADLPCDVGAATQALEIAEREGAEIVSGFRTNREADGPVRFVLSRGYNWLVKNTLGIDERDINFAFKLIRRDALAPLRLTSDGSFIHAEMFAKAIERGYRIARIPVHYTARTVGESTLARPPVIARIVADMVRFRFNRKSFDPPEGPDQPK